MRLFPLATILLLMPTAMLAAQSRTVTVGVSDFPPCVVIDKGEVTGLDVDVVEDVCRSLNLEPKFVPVKDFGVLMKGVADGRYDMAVSGISVTDHGASPVAS
jgi:ABC-type amino acid transport substrate-binding protein